MSHYASFDEKQVQAALDTLKAHHDHIAQAANFAHPAEAHLEAIGELSVSAGCIKVTVEDGQICLQIPVIGKKCINVSKLLPNGTAAEACLHICGIFPPGAKVTLSVAGHVMLTKVFGKC